MQRNPIYRSYRRVGVGSLRHAAGILVALMAASLPAWSDTLADLQGRYIAVSIEEATAPRPPPLADIHLGIQPRGNALILRWQSLPHRAGEAAHHYRVVFEKSQRPGIYMAGMRCDKFGHPQPLDAGTGEPYMWAFVGDQELTLYAMSIASDGTHDLRRYRYRRKGEGLVLTFERVRDDAPDERIRATLEHAGAQGRPGAPKPAGEGHIGVRCG